MQSFVLLPVLLKIVKHKKGTFVEEVKQHIFYTLEQHHKAAPGERITLIFDFSGAGVTNVVRKLVSFQLDSYRLGFFFKFYGVIT